MGGEDGCCTFQGADSAHPARADRGPETPGCWCVPASDVFATARRQEVCWRPLGEWTDGQCRHYSSPFTVQWAPVVPSDGRSEGEVRALL